MPPQVAEVFSHFHLRQPTRLLSRPFPREVARPRRKPFRWMRLVVMLASLRLGSPWLIGAPGQSTGALLAARRMSGRVLQACATAAPEATEKPKKKQQQQKKGKGKGGGGGGGGGGGSFKGLTSREADFSSWYQEVSQQAHAPMAPRRRDLVATSLPWCFVGGR